MWAKAGVYVGTDYTVISSCEATINCAHKQNSNCKFFPSGGKATIIVLFTLEPCECEIAWRTKLTKYEDGAWKYVRDVRSGWFNGWTTKELIIPAEEEQRVYNIRGYYSTTKVCDGVIFDPNEQTFIVGNVATENLPSAYWTKEETEHVKGMLKTLYGE